MRKITAFVAALALSSSVALAQTVPPGGTADDDDDDEYAFIWPLFGAAAFVGLVLAFSGDSSSSTSTTVEE